MLDLSTYVTKEKVCLLFTTSFTNSIQQNWLVFQGCLEISKDDLESIKQSKTDMIRVFTPNYTCPA